MPVHQTIDQIFASSLDYSQTHSKAHIPQIPPHTITYSPLIDLPSNSITTPFLLVAIDKSYNTQLIAIIKDKKWIWAPDISATPSIPQETYRDTIPALETLRSHIPCQSNIPVDFAHHFKLTAAINYLASYDFVSLVDKLSEDNTPIVYVLMSKTPN